MSLAVRVSIASVASSDARDRLGEFLCRIGKLSTQQLQDALTGAQQSGRKLGQYLVGSSMLSSHELWSAIQQQIMEIICDVVAWKDGTYAVFSLPEGFVFPQTPPLATQALVLEAVRRSDEMGLFKEKIPTYDAVLLPTGKMPRETSPLELAAIQAATSGMTLRELGSRLQRGEFDTTKVVYDLIRKGALTVSATAPSRVPAPAAAPPAVPAPLPMPSGTTIPAAYSQPQSAPAPFPMPPQQSPAQRAQDVLRVFSMALREIDAETRRHNASDAYRRGIYGFLVDPQNAYSSIFHNVPILQEGDVDPNAVMANAGAAGGADPLRAIFDAMNELTFFALFQASELLDNRVDEDLARRVRLILATLQR